MKVFLRASLPQMSLVLMSLTTPYCLRAKAKDLQWMMMYILVFRSLVFRPFQVRFWRDKSVISKRVAYFRFNLTTFSTPICCSFRPILAHENKRQGLYTNKSYPIKGISSHVTPIILNHHPSNPPHALWVC